MKRISILCSFFLFAAINTQAQSTIAYDFDGDGKQDKMNLIQLENEYKISYTLSGQSKTFQTKTITIAGQSNTLEMKNNVVILFSQFMRGENIYKFRYDAKLKQMKLIGFDNNQYGNAMNDGSGSSSYNLSTGQYEANWNYYDEAKQALISQPKLSKKYPVKNITLNTFSDAVIDKLYKVGSELLPSYMK